MFQDKYVFAQLTAFLDRNHFNYLLRKYGGDKYVKHFTCWNQLLALMFGQLSNRESLCDLSWHWKLIKVRLITLDLVNMLPEVIWRKLTKIEITTFLRHKTISSDIFNNTNFKNDKEQSGSSEPNLFNF